ncbi:PKD domain-containing protein [Alkaliflexus imshenetskii]|uniref:PKD domain-containing protein n=1 Tax=Alkaliflexus imshenetskii TaxID=286730 RepID=UPI00047E47EB|nr:PKD domain-containing protein [Alkaliflexus imshenetskii]
MKSSFLKLSLLFAGFAAIALMVGCSSDDKEADPVPPVAKFSFSVDGQSVVFTNESTNAQSYQWTFGDGNTSTEANPTHEFEDYGTFSVKLTATGAGGVDEVTNNVVIESPIIVVDGNFSDWAEVPAAKLFTASIVESETTLARLKEMKVTSDELFIYMYFKMDTLHANAMDIYLNTDLNTETGYNGWMWRNHASDYLMQGFKNANYDMRLAQYDESKGGAWGWLSPNVVEEGNGLFTMSAMKTVSGNIVEFEAKIIREFIPGLGSQVRISVGHSGVEGGPWSTSGGLPMVPAEGEKNEPLLVTLQ